MTATYDPTTALGQVRLLAIDFDLSNVIFQDADLQALLQLNANSVRLAAAQALDIIATNEVYVQKRIRTLDLMTDGPAEATQIRSQAAELRRQEFEGSGDYTGMFDWAEGVYNDFAERERIGKQFLRNDQ